MTSLKIMKNLLTLLAVLTNCHGYRILGLFPLNAKSHMMFNEQTSKGLARRGHQVDVVSTFPQIRPYPNYTDLEVPSALQQFVNNMTYEFKKSQYQDRNMVRFFAEDCGNLVCEKAFQLPQVMNLVTSTHNPPYDLVLVSVSFSSEPSKWFINHWGGKKKIFEVN